MAMERYIPTSRRSRGTVTSRVLRNFTEGINTARAMLIGRVEGTASLETASLLVLRSSQRMVAL